mmetsp:Transcript_83155/g.222907  ORF Transcript_83155/g.222907 Transcript_83155/m.222907 type:complete len:119 (-) Transcript_83155:121-477(-)
MRSGMLVSFTRSFMSAGAKSEELPLYWKEGLSVYRKLMRAAKSYQSRKRDGLIQDIRQDFKDHKDVTDQKLLLRYRSQALSGLSAISHINEASGSKNMNIRPVRHPDPRIPGDKGQIR